MDYGERFSEFTNQIVQFCKCKSVIEKKKFRLYPWKIAKLGGGDLT